MQCINAAYAVMRCLSVCVCVSVCLSHLRVVSKQIKISSKFFSPLGSHTILVFPYQTGWRYSTGTALTGASNAGGVGKKRDSGRMSGFAAYRSTVLSTVRVAKCEKQSHDERRQASSTHRGVRRPLFAQHDDEVFVTGSTLYAGDEGRSTPLVMTPAFCCRRTS